MITASILKVLNVVAGVSDVPIFAVTLLFFQKTYSHSEIQKLQILGINYIPNKTRPCSQKRNTFEEILKMYFLTDIFAQLVEILKNTF